MNNEREQYVNSEFKKWEENFVIPFEQKFSIKTMLELQYQYKNTLDDHVRAKRDLIETIQRILNNLKLKPRINKELFKVIVVSDNLQSLKNTYLMFSSMLENNITSYNDLSVQRVDGYTKFRLKTNTFEIDFIPASSVEMLKGRTAQYVINLTGNQDIDEYFRSHNQSK